jgi:23S rRNA (uracil1939-C5)-methyltransferase
LLDVESCPISREEVNRALAELRARPYVRDGHYTLRAGSEPRVFTQANDEVAGALRDLVVNLTPPNQEVLIDAYCGAGFFAKALLGKFERVIGIDWDKFAIDAARENATEKETYIAGDMERELQQVGAVHLNRLFAASDSARGRLRSIAPTTIIADPPATGLSAEVRNAIAELVPSTLIYVSCNPPTLARDLRELQEKFAIESVTPLDMFPQTAEMEAVAHLRAMPPK